MVVVPGGRVTMGLPSDDSTVIGSEHPAVDVDVAGPFAIGGREVTVEEFGHFAESTAWPGESVPCDAFRGEGTWTTDPPEATWRDPGFPQGPDHPVVCVSWNTARAYVGWLSLVTGHVYRLPTEAEHEYANRAGRAGRWPSGESPREMCALANAGDDALESDFSAYGLDAAPCDDGHRMTAPVASYPANPFGLFDMSGNVAEWTRDCYLSDHSLTPEDGTALEFDGCPFRRVKGGSWYSPIQMTRYVARLSYPPFGRITETGIRVVRELP